MSWETDALSPRQSDVLTRLHAHSDEHGYLPILSDLARDMGITYVTLKQHLEALDRKGRVKFSSRGRGRPPLVTLEPGWGR